MGHLSTVDDRLIGFVKILSCALGSVWWIRTTNRELTTRVRVNPLGMLPVVFKKVVVWTVRGRYDARDVVTVCLG